MHNICPSCNELSSELLFQFDKYFLIRCGHCDLGFVYPLPEIRKINEFYNEEYYQKNHDYLGYQNYSDMNTVLQQEAKRNIRFIKKCTDGKKLLDIGCGLGSFLKEAKKSGYITSGNDISVYAKNKIEEDLKILFYLGPAQKVLPKQSFNIITAWDVLEHVFDINRMLKSIYQSLNEGGFLFLTTPNYRSWDARIFGRSWYGYKKIPEHLLFFSPKSIKYTLEKNGFSLLKVINWGFERDIFFLFNKLFANNYPAKKILFPLFSKLGKRSVFLPVIDMMVVAKKNVK